MSQNNYYSLYFDGASRNNPGISSCGFIIYDNLGNEIKSGSKYLGDNITNNQAEYMGLVLGLQLANQCSMKNIKVHGDSLLVINQMKGKYRVKSENLKFIYDEAKKIIKLFDKIEFIHVKRGENKEADRLANEALDNL